MNTKPKSLSRFRHAVWIVVPLALVAAALLLRPPSAPAGTGPEAAAPEPGAPVVFTGSTGPVDGPWLGHNYHAVVVGINTYTNGLQVLTNARRDAEQVADSLREQYGFQVTLLLDEAATHRAIIAALDEAAARGPDSSLLVYLAGHGHFVPAAEGDAEGRGEGYFIPVDGAAPAAAGAPQPSGRWLWNRLIDKLFNTSRARHLLLVSDYCYAASVFGAIRGGAPTLKPEPHQPGVFNEVQGARELAWYRHMMERASRYVITSGSMEAVVDNGRARERFAGNLLDYLRQPPSPVFSASELAQSVRHAVAAGSSQIVMNAPILIPSHQGGEFVFYRKDWKGRWTPGTGNGPWPALAAEEPRVSPFEQLRDALVLRDAGATNGFQAGLQALSAPAAAGSSPEFLALLRALQAEGSQAERREIRETLSDLAAAARAAPAADARGVPGASARPRVLAVWPVTAGPLDPAGAATAALVQEQLRAAAAREPGLVVVDRDNLLELLQELRVSNLGADERVRAEAGRILPTSLNVGGRLLRSGAGYQLFLTVTETASTRIVAARQSEVFALADAPARLAALAAEITRDCRLHQPLRARVEPAGATSLKAGIGSFHRAHPGMKFLLVQREEQPGNAFAEHRDTPLGTARLATLGENASEFEPAWTAGKAPASLGAVWVVETE